jgi:hypothetical protein
MSKFRFNEDVNFKKILDYIEGTYGEHYGHEVNGRNIQVIDMWEGLGSLGTTSRDSALKYIARYGRKGGFNEKDLFKAVHYILLMMYSARSELAVDGDAAKVEANTTIEDYPAGYEHLDQTAADHVIRDARDYSTAPAGTTSPVNTGITETVST